MRIFGLAGWSGSGKTSLLEQVIPRLVARGFVVSAIKHAHHRFDVDQPGKDSWRHRKAGCREVLVTTGTRWALMHELQDEPELSLEAAVAHLSPCDLVLVEGYKFDPIPKLEVWRASVGKSLRCVEDPHIVAIATDSADALPALCRPLPVFALADCDAIATFIAANAIPMPAGVDDRLPAA